MLGQTIMVKAKGRLCRLNPDEILYIESSRHDITIHTKGEEQVCRMKLCDFFATLPDYFIRTHRSYAVNARYIKELGEDNICLRDGERIPVSRRRKKSVAEEYKVFTGADEQRVL